MALPPSLCPLGRICVTFLQRKDDLKNNAEDRPKPELVCQTLNEGLSKISPPQVQLAAVRWTAKGNLVVTGGPSATPQ